MIIESKKGKTKARQTLVVKSDEGAITSTFEVPTALGGLADHWYAVREKRLEIERSVDKLKTEEAAIREHLIATLPKAELATGIAGRVGRVTIKPDVVAVLKDDAKFYAYVKKTGAFDLLQRRLNEGAIKARWEAKKEVPGVEPFPVLKASITAVK